MPGMNWLAQGPLAGCRRRLQCLSTSGSHRREGLPSLDAARLEAHGCASDGIRIDTLLLVHSASGDRITTLEGFFTPICEQTGGQLVLVHPDDQLDSAVEGLVRVNCQQQTVFQWPVGTTRRLQLLMLLSPVLLSQISIPEGRQYLDRASELALRTNGGHDPPWPSPSCEPVNWARPAFLRIRLPHVS
jgi:hypothetical protein